MFVKTMIWIFVSMSSLRRFQEEARATVKWSAELCSPRTLLIRRWPVCWATLKFWSSVVPLIIRLVIKLRSAIAYCTGLLVEQSRVWALARALHCVLGNNTTPFSHGYPFQHCCTTFVDLTMLEHLATMFVWLFCWTNVWKVLKTFIQQECQTNMGAKCSNIVPSHPG